MIKRKDYCSPVLKKIGTVKELTQQTSIEDGSGEAFTQT
jgi:hypothetical protein